MQVGGLGLQENLAPWPPTLRLHPRARTHRKAEMLRGTLSPPWGWVHSEVQLGS